MNHLKSSSNISAIKEARGLFNNLRNNLSSKEKRELEKNSTKRKLPVIFLKKKSKMALAQIMSKKILLDILRILVDTLRI